MIDLFNKSFRLIEILFLDIFHVIIHIIFTVNFVVSMAIFFQLLKINSTCIQRLKE
jgi:hypothetical protein